MGGSGLTRNDKIRKGDMEIGKNDATNSTDEAVEEVITGLCCCTVSQQLCRRNINASTRCLRRTGESRHGDPFTGYSMYCVGALCFPAFQHRGQRHLGVSAPRTAPGHWRGGCAELLLPRTETTCWNLPSQTRARRRSAAIPWRMDEPGDDYIRCDRRTAAVGDDITEDCHRGSQPAVKWRMRCLQTKCSLHVWACACVCVGGEYHVRASMSSPASITSCRASGHDSFP